MRPPETGGAAFPRPLPNVKIPADEVLDVIREHAGMTLRDYFAGQALAGLIANSDLPDLFAKGFAPHKAAEIVYMVADAMIAERAKGGA